MPKARSVRTRKPSTPATAKAKVGKAQSPAQGEAASMSVAPTVADKYAHLSVYDPASRTVLDASGNAVTAAPPTLAELSQTPGPLRMLDRLYACETADETTIQQLAALAGIPISVLESKRHDFVRKPDDPPPCPRETPYNRRRCIWCPWWRLADETPF